MNSVDKIIFADTHDRLVKAFLYRFRTAVRDSTDSEVRGSTAEKISNFVDTCTIDSMRQSMYQKFKHYDFNS
jgi:hypothetical protein